jgi:hypothetical protein
VAEGDPGSASNIIQKTTDEENQGSASPNDGKSSDAYGALRLKDKRSDGTSSFLGQPWWRWVAWFGLIVFFSFIGLVVFDQAKKRSLVQLEVLKRRQNQESFWKNLEKEVSRISKNDALTSYSNILEKIEDELYHTLDAAFGIASRAMPNRDLANALTEHHAISADDAREVVRIREFIEMVRFSSHASSSDSEEASREIVELVQKAKKLCLDFSSRKIG